MKLLREQMDDVIELLKEHHSFSVSDGSFSESKARFLIERHLDDPKTLMLVNKGMTAVLILQITTPFFTNKPEVQEVCFFSKTNGSGFRLIKEAKSWIDRWGDGIRGAFLMSTGSEKTNKMIERFGMKQVGVIFNMKGEG